MINLRVGEWKEDVEIKNGESETEEKLKNLRGNWEATAFAIKNWKTTNLDVEVKEKIKRTRK